MGEFINDQINRPNCGVRTLERVQSIGVPNKCHVPSIWCEFQVLLVLHSIVNVFDRRWDSFFANLSEHLLCFGFCTFLWVPNERERKEAYEKEGPSVPSQRTWKKKIIVFEWYFGECGRFAANDAVLIQCNDLLKALLCFLTFLLP